MKRARGRRLSRSRVEVGVLSRGGDSAGADNSHRCDLDRYRKRQRIRPERCPGVTPGIAKDLYQEVRCAVDNLGLFAKTVDGQHVTGQLGDLLNVVESGGSLHLGEQVERADLGPSRGLLDRNLVGTPAGQPLVAFTGHVARDVQKRSLVTDGNQPRLHVRRGRRRCRRELYSEFVQTLLRAAHDTRVYSNRYRWRARTCEMPAVTSSKTATTPNPM